ncbi:hypothetical protein DP113_20125 [Brasilonema octagenarum UFV-E1]|uniref:Uncharacterized protein n=1 Tax=Brasilonema sennae CENA114 TaxID=415709 RepID=A0A856MEY4_9CYAN|nr:hypothetical protein [Brasilonema sennae]QDL09895.1 hypothetical protein DP114_20200 [Brasilonema sennae CENA114]QDL16247.1 hypothetical protein DP113_20125 [Brasilonema octagenarum UFV-E1]
MPKFYLHRTGKIPTAVHPFVKQTALPEVKQKPWVLQGKIIRGVQNIAMSMSRTISIASARLIRFISRRPMS